MLARRRLRQKEKRKKRSIEATARDVVQVELELWRRRIAEAKKESETRRTHYEHQEGELRRLYDNACKQLDKRRATLLATTSLIPYTQTIQSSNNFRVPAALLTLQARLCLHVHCLCVHEELLLRTKEQGWDTIAWMEDVSRHLRLLTTEQISTLRSQMQDEVNLLQENIPEIQIPEGIRRVLQEPQVELALDQSNNEQVNAVHDPSNFGGASGNANDRATTDATAGMGKQQPGADSKEESFMQFLQRYEQRKEHQAAADQMRLAEFRSRGNSEPGMRGTTSNPYTARRAHVGKRLKNYASKLFQNNSNSRGGGGFGGMDGSLHLEDFPAPDSSNNIMPNTIGEESNSSLASVGGGAASEARQSWIPFRRSGSVQMTQSESNLDAGWSLGSSLRGLRKRGLRRSSGIDNMETQAEAGENSSSSGSSDGEPEEFENGQDGDGSWGPSHQEVGGRTDDSNAINADEKDDNNLGEAPRIGDNNGEDNGQTQTNLPSASPLKSRLKAPGIQKFFESSRW